MSMEGRELRRTGVMSLDTWSLDIRSLDARSLETRLEPPASNSSVHRDEMVIHTVQYVHTILYNCTR
jgi:hypothetical protein